jgi:hypothetical protein
MLIDYGSASADSCFPLDLWGTVPYMCLRCVLTLCSLLLLRPLDGRPGPICSSAGSPWPMALPGTISSRCCTCCGGCTLASRCGLRPTATKQPARNDAPRTKRQWTGQATTLTKAGLLREGRLAVPAYCYIAAGVIRAAPSVNCCASEGGDSDQ